MKTCCLDLERGNCCLGLVQYYPSMGAWKWKGCSDMRHGRAAMTCNMSVWKGLCHRVKYLLSRLLRTRLLRTHRLLRTFFEEVVLGINLGNCSLVALYLQAFAFTDLTQLFRLEPRLFLTNLYEFNKSRWLLVLKQFMIRRLYLLSVGVGLVSVSQNLRNSELVSSRTPRYR